MGKEVSSTTMKYPLGTLNCQPECFPAGGIKNQYKIFFPESQIIIQIIPPLESLMIF